MAEQGAGHPVPGVTIDEALELFLGVAYPRGLPEGADREAIVAALRARIAQDRPEWAQAYTPPAPPQPDTAAYSEVKAAAVERARQADLPPTDPEERYLYMRRLEAQQHSAERKADARESQVRADLVARLSASRKPPAPGEVERVLAIRRELEQRLKLGAPETTPPSKPAPSLGVPQVALQPLAQSGLQSGIISAGPRALAPFSVQEGSSGLALDATPRPEPVERDTGRHELSGMDDARDAAVSAFKTMLDTQQARLPKRESLLAPRRPERTQLKASTRERAPLQASTRERGEGAAGTGLSLSEPVRATRPQLWPEPTRRKSRGLTLE